MQAVSAVALTAALAGLAVWRLSCDPARPPPTPPPPPRGRSAPAAPANDSDHRQLEPACDALESTLIDLRNFTYLAGGGLACNASDLYVALVHSAAGHRRRRDAVRRTWGRLAPRLVFLVGETEDSAVRQDIEAEIARYGDMVQGNFVDSYRNLTYKHVMGLKWVACRCPSTKYVVKLDDDVFVNTPRLPRYLSPQGARGLVLCNVQERGMVKRSYRSKWRVTPGEYPGRFYPAYCCGWAVVYSADAVRRLYHAAQRSPYFWVDDVHVTGTLAAQTNLTHKDAASVSKSEEEVEEWLERRVVPEEFIFAMTSWENFRPLWSLLPLSAEEAVTPAS